MGKKGKGKRNKSEPSPSQETSSLQLKQVFGQTEITAAAVPVEASVVGTCSLSPIPHPADDKQEYCIKNSKGRHNIKSDQQSLLGGKQNDCLDEKDRWILIHKQVDEVQNSENNKVNRRKEKRERQKNKKSAKIMAVKRRESELSLGEFDIDHGDPSSQTTINYADISLYRRPIITMEYFLREFVCVLGDVKQRYVASRSRRGSVESAGFAEIVFIFLVITSVLAVTYFWIATNDPTSTQIKQYTCWYFYWIFLGILSSVGLGTGLHTFVLYLGPFIAKVSLAAQECSSLEFPDPPYPNQIICPSDFGMGHSETPSIWSIAAKVRWETLAWGFGTALGELPPYFVARAASLAGDGSHTDDLDNTDGFLAKIQRIMRNFVKKVGFWGILLCASIPNPLFDLAGITCGHFQVPFIIFFGATAIGKTIVKSQLQMIFVILAFNQKSLERVLKHVSNIPKVGASLSKMFTDFVDYQRASLHNENTAQSGGVLKLIMEVIVFLMILYFVTSIINGMARSYHKRITSPPKSTNPGNKTTTKAKKRLKSQT